MGELAGNATFHGGVLDHQLFHPTLLAGLDQIGYLLMNRKVG
ncbi:MAG: hypothetical protein ACLQRH_11825 [Acidimicrobiales bacterium]